MADRPRRLLIVRPDTYGDLVLFEPALRLLRERWPGTRITMLVRAPYRDLAHLLSFELEWMTTTCNPYREGFLNADVELARLRAEVETLDPDCVVAACFNKTWLGALVASWAPGARRVSLGSPAVDPITSILIERHTGRDATAWYPETVDVAADSPDSEKNLSLAAWLLGEPAPALRPALQVPAEARVEAERWLTARGLRTGEFLVCCPAGGANVSIKSWPLDRYASVLATAAGELGVASVIVGHETEAELLEQVAELVERETGSRPPVWLGRDGGFAATAALVAASRAYLGNDTGLAHVASAVERPALVVYGGGTWPRFLPAGHRAIAAVQPLPCFGCGWNCLFDEALCLTQLSTALVADGLRRLLGPAPIEGHEVLADAPPSLSDRARIAEAVAAAAEAPDGTGGRRRTLRMPRADLERLIDQWLFAEGDRAARLEVIERQGDEIGRLRAADQRDLVTTLEAQLAASEADRAARLEVIERQGAELGRLPGLEADVAALTVQLAVSEADRAARLEVIERQGAELGRLPGLEAELAAQTARTQALDAEMARSQAEATGLRVRFELARRSRLYRVLRRLGLLGDLDTAPPAGKAGGRS